MKNKKKSLVSDEEKKKNFAHREEIGPAIQSTNRCLSFRHVSPTDERPWERKFRISRMNKNQRKQNRIIYETYE